MALASKPKRPKRNPARSCLGPVADLEAHLPPEWWRKLFNALYVKTDGDVVENVENTRREVDFIVSAAAIQPVSHILDLCCGQGRHCLELARRGFRNVVGVDRSRYLIRLARKRAQSENLQVVFKEGDARNPRLADSSFDCVVIMGNSFGYFSNKQDDEKVLATVGKILRTGGQRVLDITDGAYRAENFERRSWEWIDEHHFVCRERSISQDKERLISREVIVHDEMGVIADQFYAERLYTKEGITRLLEKTGFRNVRHHGIAEALEPPAPIRGNAYREKGEPLPIHWATAIERFRQSEFAAAYLGRPFRDHFTAVKQGELDEFDSHLTPLEMQWYLGAI